MNIPCLCNPVVLSLVDFSRRLLRLLHMFKEVSEGDSQSEGDYHDWSRAFASIFSAEINFPAAEKKHFFFEISGQKTT